MNNQVAQVFKDLGNPIKGIGPLGLENANADAAPTVFNSFFSGLIAVMTAIAAIWFIIQFITGAIGIVSSGGEKGALENARNKITTGLIGLVVTVAAIFIIDIVGKILGVNFILNPGDFIRQLKF